MGRKYQHSHEDILTMALLEGFPSFLFTLLLYTYPNKLSKIEYFLEFKFLSSHRIPGEIHVHKIVSSPTTQGTALSHRESCIFVLPVEKLAVSSCISLHMTHEAFLPQWKQSLPFQE